MTGALARMAWASSWGGDRAERLRSGLLALTAAALAVLFCGLTAAHQLLERVDHRSAARAMTPAGPGDLVALEREAIFDVTPNGDQIYVQWTRIVDGDAAIPGLPDPPAEGWYVSPALASRIDRDPHLARRFPGARRIGDGGIAHADELLAYRIVGQDVELRYPYTDRPTEGQSLTDPPDLTTGQLVKGSLVLLLVPAVGLALAGVAPASPAVDRRLGVLTALGAGPRQVFGLVIGRAILCSLPGAALGAAAWVLVGPRLTQVPVLRRAVLVGDLAIGLGQAGAAGVIAVGLLAAASGVRGRRSPTNRPSVAVPRAPSLLRLVPVATGVAMMLRGSTAGGASGTRLFLGGVVASATGGVVALPLLLRRLGHRLAGLDGVLASLVGRRLWWNATASARSLLVVGALATSTPLVASYLELSRSRIADPHHVADPQPVWVTGELEAEDRAAVVAATGATTFLAVIDPNAPNSTTEAPSVLLVGNCDELGRRVELARCDGRGFEVAASSAASFAGFRTYEGTEPRPVLGVTDAPEGTEVVATAFLADDWHLLDEELRTRANNADRLWPQVADVLGAKHEAPIARWIYGGATVATLVGAAAIALHLVAQATRLRDTTAVLSALGAPRTLARRLAAAESGASVLAAGVVALGLGIVGNWCYVQLEPDAAIHGRAVVAVLALTSATAVVAGCLSWTSTARRQERAP